MNADAAVQTPNPEPRPRRYYHRRRHPAGKIAWGLIIISVGVLFLLDQLGMADASRIIHRYWPVGIIVWGLAFVVAGLDRRPDPDPYEEAR